MKKNIILVASIIIAVCASIIATNSLTRKMATETIIARSEHSADSWVRHFSSQIGGFENVIEDGRASVEQVQILDDARSFVDVFRFKLFDKEGRLILLSDDIGLGNAGFLRDDEANTSALNVIRRGTQETFVIDGRTISDRPNWFAETYIPLSQDGVVIGAAEVYVDISDGYTDIEGGFQRLTKNLVIIFLIFSAFPIGIVLWFFEDLKQSNRHLKKSRMEAGTAVRAKSQFLANMSHEIRTPMNGVIGMAELLSETKLDDEQRSITNTIVQSANALLIIINDVLDFSKIDSGNITISKLPFNLHSCIESAVILLAPAADRKGLELCLNISNGVPAWIEGDDARLRQCLLNLVGNAVKFTKTGHIELEARMGRENELVFLVKDTGVGIPAGLEAKVFADFEQVENSETREIEGTGLGLAITRKLINLMGGEIGYTSKIGVGTEFTFSLPIATVAPLAFEGSPNSIELKGLRALIVDDLEVNRRILTERLKSLGMTSQAATSYQDAMEILSNSQASTTFDVAILDHHMPHKSGADLAISMRGTPGIASLPIVFLSSGNLDSLKDRVKGLGLHEIISKPVKTADLIKAIGLAVSRDKVSSHPFSISTGPNTTKSRFPLRVAIAEDNPINQELMLRVVGPIVDDLVIWDNGEIAVSQIENWKPDLVFMDISMPVMDGLSATREIRKLERIKGKKEVPIVALTANAMSEDEDRCLAAGMTGYLSKPMRKADILKVLAMYTLAGTDNGDAQQGKLSSP